MRFASAIPAALVVMVSSAALAAEWAEFVDRGDHVLINFPGDPAVKDLAYKTAKGTTLPAHVYSAEDTRGQYILTVVDYRTAAPDEQAAAIQEASKAVRAKGKITYDEPGRLDGHLSQRITVETADKRWLSEILMSNEKRLYILEGSTGLKAPPSAHFQTSIQVLNDEGTRIRYVGGQETGKLDPRGGN